MSRAWSGSLPDPALETLRTWLQHDYRYFRQYGYKCNTNSNITNIYILPSPAHLSTGHLSQRSSSLMSACRGCRKPRLSTLSLRLDSEVDQAAHTGRTQWPPVWQVQVSECGQAGQGLHAGQAVGHVKAQGGQAGQRGQRCSQGGQAGQPPEEQEGATGWVGRADAWPRCWCAECGQVRACVGRGGVGGRGCSRSIGAERP